jgi:choice-of-anchor C domain-containing protein
MTTIQLKSTSICSPRRHWSWLVATTFVLALAVDANAVNLVTNGSFESPSVSGDHVMISAVDSVSIPGWVVDEAGTSVDLAQGVWFDADGFQSVDMNGIVAGSLYQDLATTAGVKYTIRFALAGNAFGQDDKRLEVLWDGAQIADVTFDQLPEHNHINMGWSYHQLMATASGSSTRLTFHSLTGPMDSMAGFLSWYGPVIDDVSVEAVPEPSAALLAVFVAVLAAPWRRGNG